ncbi:MAG: beta-ketoacyl-ACP synthase II [Chloroflexota bacterium]|nr:beta-ketoacyl-ACP synthase II [Chloroflexota bacterium]MDQ5865034.1 beta-ketoacyl-ACP synthase II [Chloroflexota bacterium]
MENGRRRVVITGLGAVSPLGNDVESSWRGVIEGRSGVGPITRFDSAGYETQIAAEVRDFNTDEYVPPKEQRRMDRFIHYAIAVCKQAGAQAGLEITPDNAEEIGVLMGSGIGGIETLTDAVLTIRDKGPNRVSPFTIPMLLTDLAAGQVSIQMGLKGPNFAVVSACSSGAHAIGEAAELIKRGQAKAMFAGGSEATVCSVGIATFGAMRALSTRNDDPTGASRPFDKLRDGFVLAEGAAAVLLEDLEYAKGRGANIIAEVVGYGSTSDASHVTAPAEGGEGAARAMRMALRSAGLKPADIGYINAHGTGTPLNEKYETLAIKGAMGEHAYKVPVSSTKSMTGHMLGAAGSMEAIFCIKALHEGILPPTINQEVPDPDCDLDYVPNEARKADIRYAMSNSMGFGGHNAVLILRRYEV